MEVTSEHTPVWDGYRIFQQHQPTSVVCQLVLGRQMMKPKFLTFSFFFVKAFHQDLGRRMSSYMYIPTLSSFINCYFFFLNEAVTWHTIVIISSASFIFIVCRLPSEFDLPYLQMCFACSHLSNSYWCDVFVTMENCPVFVLKVNRQVYFVPLISQHIAGHVTIKYHVCRWCSSF